MTHLYSRYPPIADYAMISDCRCAALISRTGSVDWCCMPRFDDDSCFGRLLDWERGGYCALNAIGEDVTTSREYVANTMVLATRFKNENAEAVLYDFFAMDDGKEKPCFEHVRIVEGIRGNMEFEADIVPRFDYGEISPYLRRIADHTFMAIGSNKGLVIHADFSLEMADRHRLAARFNIGAGQRRHMVLCFEYPDYIETAVKEPLPEAKEMDRRLDYTCRWWSDWTARGKTVESDPQTLRSLIVLKALTYEPSGAIIAAPTTSLPECSSGPRNWDYRYSWIRDSVFAVRALSRMGYTSEANAFHRFIQRSSAGSADQLQIMYRVDGKRRLTEVELDWMDGYRGSRPVRIGNGASKQKQIDIYGELLLMAWNWHLSGHRADAEYWDFLRSVVDTVCRDWKKPDHGIWELRDKPRHLVHSKAMCWAAMDCGMRLAEDLKAEVPLSHWREVRDEIRYAIDTDGYDAQRGIYTQSFSSSALDAALLTLPRFGFVAYDDPRMLRTVDAIRTELEVDGLICRYNAPDGLPKGEGTFLPCTFWLVTCLARQGKKEDAWRYYQRAAQCANDVGLFSEEYDMQADAMLGNFPQGLTHVSQISARMALDGKD